MEDNFPVFNEIQNKSIHPSYLIIFTAAQKNKVGTKTKNKAKFFAENNRVLGLLEPQFFLHLKGILREAIHKLRKQGRGREG